MPAVILAAGEGRRLRPVTEHLAKPMVPVLNVPLLFWAVAALTDAGATGFVANVHTRADQLRDAAAGLRERHGVELDLVAEDVLSGPAGGLAACRDRLPDNDCCLVVSGDAVTEIDLGQVVERHRATGADLTIIAKRVPDAHRFGMLDLVGDEVVGLLEKPADPPPDAVVSCGIYVLSTRALARLDPDVDSAYDFKHVVPSFLAQGLAVRAHRTDAYWTDVGTPEALRQANLRALTTGAISRVSAPAGHRELFSQGEVDCGSGLEAIGPVLLGADSVLGDGVVLERSVIGTGARVGAGARIRNSVVLPGAVVPAGQVLQEEVVL